MYHRISLVAMNRVKIESGVCGLAGLQTLNPILLVAMNKVKIEGGVCGLAGLQPLVGSWLLPVLIG